MGYAVLVMVLADLAVIGVCVFYLTRAGGALEAQSQKQRLALDAARVALERLVAHADERARDLEQALGARERQLRDLLYRLAEQEDRVREAAGEPRETQAARPGLAAQAQQLAARGLDALEVARELEIDPAEARVMLDLYDARGRAVVGAREQP
jgi:hypothetical protein